MKELLSQQQEAIAHLRIWKVGALFMEAGTGKTRVACELVNSIDNIDLILWVGPYQTIHREDGTSVIEEISKWGGFKCENIIYVGVETISQSDRSYIDIFNNVQKSKHCFIVIDESLKIKNLFAIRTKRMIRLGEMAEYKLVLNGTPFSKNILDIYSQMQFLSPRILDMTLAQYKDTFCDYTKITKPGKYGMKYTKEYINGFENIDYLYSLIKSYIYECDLNLNITQNYHNISYHVDDECRSKYNEYKDYYLSDEMATFYNDKFFFAMTNAMQHSYCICKEKFDAIDSLLKDSIVPEKTVIFCRYIISTQKCRERYKNCLVLSYQKESLGLNLQNYSNTIYFDKIWDLALRTQSGRRTYRTGQELNCQYYDLTGDIGLEKLIDKNISRKISQTEYFKQVSKEKIKKEL